MTHDSPGRQRFLPIGLDLQGKRCLVVGGGGIGTRKALTLARAGAMVTVVSLTITAELAKECEVGRVSWVKEPFRPDHLEGAFLVVAATDDGTQNASVVRAATEHGALTCDASSAARSQVIFGALFERDGSTIAVFTDGRDPALARQTRDEIATLVTRKK